MDYDRVRKNVIGTINLCVRYNKQKVLLHGTKFLLGIILGFITYQLVSLFY